MCLRRTRATTILHLGRLVTLALGAQRVLAGKHEHARRRLPREAAERAHLRRRRACRSSAMGLSRANRPSTRQQHQRPWPRPGSSACCADLARRAHRSPRPRRWAPRPGRWSGLRPAPCTVRTLSPTGGRVSVPSSSKRRSASCRGWASSTSSCEPAMVITSPAMTMRAPATATPLMLIRPSGAASNSQRPGHGAQRRPAAGASRPRGVGVIRLHRTRNPDR